MKTKPDAPTREESKRLYELAGKLKELGPWEWMDESEIFGVENPESNEIGFVSVMGMMGEHLAIGIYLGSEGLYGFWGFQDEKHETEPLALFDIPQLQASFEDREQLKKEDREVIKNLGLKFRGKQSYPMFRSNKSGFMPWFITSEEARFLIYTIEQTLEVAPRARENPLILVDENGEEEVYLVRALEREGGNLVWRDEMKYIPPPESKQFSVKVSPETINQLKAFPQNKNFIFEIDLFHAPTPVMERNSRPFFPKILIITETNSLFILGVELMKPQEDILDEHAEIAKSLIKILSSHSVLPKEIRVSSDLLFGLLKSFTQQLNVKLRQTGDLIATKEAKEGMFGFFGNPFF
jgi:hypothetical protein